MPASHRRAPEEPVKASIMATKAASAPAMTKPMIASSAEVASSKDIVRNVMFSA